MEIEKPCAWVCGTNGEASAAIAANRIRIVLFISYLTISPTLYSVNRKDFFPACSSPGVISPDPYIEHDQPAACLLPRAIYESFSRPIPDYLCRHRGRSLLFCATTACPGNSQDRSQKYGAIETNNRRPGGHPESGKVGRGMEKTA